MLGGLWPRWPGMEPALLLPLPGVDEKACFIVFGALCVQQGRMARGKARTDGPSPPSLTAARIAVPT